MPQEVTEKIEKLKDVIARQSIVTTPLQKLLDEHGEDAEVVTYTSHTPFGSYLMGVELNKPAPDVKNMDVKDVIQKYEDHVKKYYETNAKYWKAKKDDHMVQLAADDLSGHLNVIEYMRAGEWKSADRSFSRMDTASRDNITNDAYELMISHTRPGDSMRGAGGRVVSDAVINDVVEWIGKDATPEQIRKVLDYLLTEPGLRFPQDFKVVAAISPEDQQDKADRIVRDIYAHDIQPGMLDEIGEETVKAILWGLVMTATTTNLKGNGGRVGTDRKPYTIHEWANFLRDWYEQNDIDYKKHTIDMIESDLINSPYKLGAKDAHDIAYQVAPLLGTTKFYSGDMHGSGTRIPSIRVSLASAKNALDTLHGDNFFKDKIQNVGSDGFVSNDKARLYEFYQQLLQMNEEVVEQNIADDDGYMIDDDDDMHGKGTRLTKHLSPEEYSRIRKTPTADLYVYDGKQHLYNLYDEKMDNKKLERFMANFPDDAKSWAQATDEMRDLARRTREAYNELVIDVVEGDPGYVEGLDFRSFKTPSEWNTKSKAFIREMWAKLTPYAKQSVIEWIDDINEVNPQMRGAGVQMPSDGCTAPNGTFYLEIGNIINEKDAGKTTTLYRYEILRYDKNAEGKSVAVVKEATATESKPTPEFTITLENICNRLVSGVYEIDGRSLTIPGSVAIANALIETEAKYIEQKLKCAEKQKEHYAILAELDDHKNMLTGWREEAERLKVENTKLASRFQDQKSSHDDTMAGVGALYGAGAKIAQSGITRLHKINESIAALHKGVDDLRLEEIDDAKLDKKLSQIFIDIRKTYDSLMRVQMTIANEGLSGSFNKESKADSGKIMDAQIKKLWAIDAAFSKIDERFENILESMDSSLTPKTLKKVFSLLQKNARVHEKVIDLIDYLDENLLDGKFDTVKRSPGTFEVHGAGKRIFGDKNWFKVTAKFKTESGRNRTDGFSIGEDKGKTTVHKNTINKWIKDIERETGWSFIDGSIKIEPTEPPFGDGARIPNNYDGKTPADVWDAWDTAQREHFYLDHLEMLPKGGISKTISRPFAGLDSSIQDIISEHIRGGQYGKGKRIPDADFSTEDESTVAEFLKGKSIKTYLHGPDGDSEEIKGFRVSDKKYSRRTCYVKVANDYEYKFDLKDLASFLKGSTIEITTDRGERMDIELANPMKGAGAIIGSVAVGFLAARLYDYYKDNHIEEKVNGALKGNGGGIPKAKGYKEKSYMPKSKKPRATSNWNVETKDGKKVTVISSTRPMKNWTRTTIEADGSKAVVIAKTFGRA